MPSWAVARRLDLGAACSGFVYALAVGSQFVQTGLHDRVLVIGADTLTSFVDWTDRSTCILFGDGAGAVVLAPTARVRGFFATDIGATAHWPRPPLVPGWERLPRPAEHFHE